MAEQVLFPSLYEEDFILRSLGSIVNQPETALTELVANAWDAGASRVEIQIPEELQQKLTIQDDGIGMTEEEFQNRWMKLRYNRSMTQGKKVVFPNGTSGNRTAFGRNGVGRHGMFCFGENYTITTSKDGKSHRYTIKPNIQAQPFAVTERSSANSESHGTTLEVIVSKNLPKADKITEILSARFLLDPSFKIIVNGASLDLVDLAGGQEPRKIVIPKYNVNMELYFIDTTQSGRKSIFQGIAFWQSGRLVGEPSWNLGSINVLDGRTSLAKRYTVVIKSEDLADSIKEDWSGFVKNEKMQCVYEHIEKELNACFEEIASTTYSSYKENLSPEIKQAIERLNPLAKKEFEETLSTVVLLNPRARQESIDIAAQAIINLERTRNGQELLEKLSKLSDDDVAELNNLLSKWSITDAAAVLNEIDRRLSVIEAIRKLSSDPTTDELHVLHPLITESRWLFGPEYESSEYTFNRQLGTIIKQTFGNEVLNSATNPKKRPDLLCLPNDSSLSVTGIEDTDKDSKLIYLRKILIIELKKGGFRIKREERNQAQGYVEDLYSNNISKQCDYTAFVVGDKVDTNISAQTDVCDGHGRIFLTTYGQLVDTAESRMFNLRNKLAHRYDDVPGMELYNQSRLF